MPCLTNPQPQLVIWKKMGFFLPFSPPWRSSSQPPTTRREEQHLRGIRQPHPFLLLELLRCTFWHIPQPVPAPPAGTMTASGVTQPHLAVVVQPDLPARPLLLDTTRRQIRFRGTFLWGRLSDPKARIQHSSPACVTDLCQQNNSFPSGKGIKGTIHAE